MKKTIIFMAIILFLNMNLVNAITLQEINEAKNIIDSKIDCKSLSNSQLEILGEYYMEQMHPGESHELMHKMMGLQEGSEAEEQFHLNMAKTIYCDESGGMMGGGMMGSYPTYYSYNSFWNIPRLVFLIGIIALIIWLIYKFTKKKKESETPIDILQKRYAKGEINKKQFDEIKKELRE